MPFARIATLASTFILLVLAGCDRARPASTEAAPTPSVAASAVPLGSETVPPSPTPAATTEAPTTSSPSAKRDDLGGGTGPDRFVAAVQQKLPDVTLDRRDEEVAELGQQACTSLKHGHDTSAAASEISDEGVAPPDARTLVSLAKDTLCRK